MNRRKDDYRIKVYGSSNKKIVFFFCPFGVRRWQFLLPHLPIQQLVKHGFQVVSYDFNNGALLNSLPKFQTIVGEISSDVQLRTMAYKKAGLTSFSVFGISVGTIFAANAAAASDDIDRAILNLSYGDIAEHILTYKNTLKIPKKVLKNMRAVAGSEHTLREELTRLSPLHLAPALSKKRILLYLAVNDRMLLYENSKRLKSKLVEQDTDLVYIESKIFGHWWSAVINNFNSKLYLAFLNRAD